MDLFNEAIIGLNNYLADAQVRKALRCYQCNDLTVWPEQPSLVLQEDTVVELGGSYGSLFMVLWTEQADMVSAGRISLVGDDLFETDLTGIPLTQVVIVNGSYKNEFETCQVLQDIIFYTRPKDVSIRFWPDRQKIWYRVSSEALENGFSLARQGCTIIKNLNALSTVEGVEVIFVTEAQHNIEFLAPLAGKVRETTEALLKIYDQLNFDCESCEFKDVCAEVVGLKKIHQRLHEERERM